MSFHPRAVFGNELSLYTEGRLSSDFWRYCFPVHYSFTSFQHRCM